MAVQTASPSKPSGSPNAVLYTWTALANSDTGSPVAVGDFDDMTVTVSGTFGTGGTIKFRGSNDGTNYYDLTDQSATAISKTAAGISAVAEKPLFVRPEVTGGDGTTVLQCRLVMRKRMR